MTFTAETAADSAARSTRPGGLKPLFARGLLICLAATAAVHIHTVLTESFGETGLRILASSLLAGLYCMFCLAAMTVLDTRHRLVGTAGISTATTALAQGLFLIWSVGADTPDDTFLLIARGFLLTAIVAFALAHAALLLRIDLGDSGPVAAVRAATLTVMGMVSLLLAAPLVETPLADSEGYWRLLAALAILDVLGTVCLPVLARLDVRSTR